MLMQTEFTCGIYTAIYVREYGWRLDAGDRIIGGIDTDGNFLSFSHGRAIGITQDTLIEIAVLMNNIKRQYKQLQTTS